MDITLDDSEKIPPPLIANDTGPTPEHEPEQEAHVDEPIDPHE